MITLKRLKTAALCVALMGGVSTTFAQTVPQTPVQTEQAKKIDVKDSELEEFANIFQQVMQKNQEAQQEMMAVIKKEGMTTQRYIELRKAEAAPEQSTAAKATGEEKTQKKAIDAEIEKLQPKYEKEFDAIVKDSKLGADRYEEIATAIRYDQDLQQRVQKILIAKSASQVSGQ